MTWKSVKREDRPVSFELFSVSAGEQESKINYRQSGCWYIITLLLKYRISSHRCDFFGMNGKLFSVDWFEALASGHFVKFNKSMILPVRSR